MNITFKRLFLGFLPALPPSAITLKPLMSFTLHPTVISNSLKRNKIFEDLCIIFFTFY